MPSQPNPYTLPGVITEKWFTDTFGRPGSEAELLALEPKLNQYGIKVARNAAGVAGKVIFPNNAYHDIIIGAGDPSRRGGFQWPGDVNLGAAPTTAPAAAQTVLGGTAPAGTPGRWPYNPSTGKRQPPKPGQAADPLTPPTSPNPYGAAQLAANRQRGKSNRGGRTSTILGGFTPGRPSTRPATLLGGGY